MDLELIREGSIPELGTPGTLNCGSFAFHTIEREWLDNRPGQSCIPTGRYRLEPYSSKKYPNHYALVNHDLDVFARAGDIPKGIKGRWGILIHIANIARQLEGCIAVGMSPGYTTIDRRVGFGVLHSTPAFNTLMSLLGSDEEHFITITEKVQSW